MGKHITLVAAARPNFMKIAPLAHALEKDAYFSYTLVHTGQHFDKKMSDTFFKQLSILGSTMSNIKTFNKVLEKINNQTKFSKKIDELNQETEILIGNTS